jgi:hypothetical protein
MLYAVHYSIIAFIVFCAGSYYSGKPKENDDGGISFILFATAFLWPGTLILLCVLYISKMFYWIYRKLALAGSKD